MVSFQHTHQKPMILPFPRFLKRQFLLWVVAVFLLCGGCTTPKSPVDILTNPVDPNGSAFGKPQTTIVSGPANGSTVTSSSVQFVVIGSKDAVQFSSKLDQNVWTSWNAATTINFDNLDEGAHSITVRARHRDGETIEENPQTNTFTVNAVTGPALMFVPRKTIASRGTAFGVEVYAEEVTDLAGAKVVVEFDKTMLSISSIDVYKDAKSILLKSGGSVIDVTEIDNVNGRLTLNVANAGGTPANVSGTGPIAKIWFLAASTAPAALQTSFNAASQFRTADNSIVVIKMLVNGIIELR